MAFKSRKAEAINNLLAAEKVGDLDLELKPLLYAINSLPEYYTTSSCGGRMVLMQDLGRKGLDNFLGKWHGRISQEEVLSALKPCKGVVWLRYESPILHIMARSLKAAGWMLQIARESGFKRSGIQSLKDERILIEVLSTERVDSPVMDNGRILVSDEYIAYLVGEANSKYGAGGKKLRRLHERILSKD